MPKYSYGSAPKERVLRFVEALLQYANEELGDYELKDLSCAWQDRGTPKLRLVVRTKLRALSHLSVHIHDEAGLNEKQIREVLRHYLSDFLGILEDHREKPQGSNGWHFSLSLQSEDWSNNQQWLEQLWRDKRNGTVKVPDSKPFEPQPSQVTPRLNPGAPFQAPPLPRHYVERPEHFEAIKAMLLDESTPGTLVISAIYGMGGIGKSVLAAALVQDSEIQQQFSDGVLWVTLGQQPDMLSMVNLWIRALGDYDYNPTTLTAASLHLRTLLADKKALLVIDDVWHPEHVEPFQVRGEGCCVLVTTRQTQIVGAREYDLTLMTPEQSLELLTKYLPNPLSEVERFQAEAFAKEVGYLPLALELAAARIKKGVFWDELLTAFQKEITVLNLTHNVDAITDESIRKQHSLVASFKLTLKLLSPQQLEKFAWLGIAPEDVTLTQEMGATLWGVESFESGEILRDFKDQALLLPQAQRSGERPTYRIHDLVHDLAKNLLTHEQYLDDLPGLGLTFEAAHSQFLGRYQAQTKDGLWHTVPVDGYIHSHLAWHFEQSDQPELIHQLLKESTPDGRNGWYVACDQLGQTASFVTDVARAWQTAEELYDQHAIEAIALQYRCALITTSLNSLAQNIPPELIAAFVQKGFWKPAQGLAYVRQSQQQFQRADGLMKLAPHLPETLMSEALTIARSIQNESSRAYALSGLAAYVPEVVSEALAVARSIEDEFSRIEVLSELAINLPETLTSEALAIACAIQGEYLRARALSGLAAYVPEVVSKALAVARSIEDEYLRADILSELAAYVPETLMSETLAIARSIQDKYSRARALSGLAAYVPEVVSEALAVARSIQDEYSQADILSRLAAYVPDVVGEALAVARSIQDESSRANVLSRLAAYVPETLMSETLAMARSIQDESSRANVLSELAAYVPETLMSETLAVARSIQDESFRANVLSGLATNVPETLMSETLAIARSIQDEYSQADALSGLAVYVPEVMSEVLAIARSIQNEYFRADALSGLAYVPETLISEALAVARSIQDEYSRAYALSGLAAYVPEGVCEALVVVRSIQDDFDRADALSKLAVYVPETMMSEALTVARSIQDESSRVYALSGLAAYVPDLVSEVLAVARLIQNESSRALALRRLATNVPETMMSEALAVARSIQIAPLRALALIELTAYVPETMMSEALTVARSIQDASSRADALSGLAAYVPDLVSEALAVARSIQDKSSRARALSGLAAYVPDLVSEALAVARSIQDKSSRARALSGLAAYVPDLVSEALAVACSVQDESNRARALSGLLHNLKTIETDIVIWKEVIHTLAYRDRQSFLADIPKLAPAMLSLCGEDKAVLNLVVEAMHDVCRQWP